MQNYVEEISQALANYRPEDDIKRDTDHVYQWLSQFRPHSQRSIAEGTARILSQFFLSKEACTDFIDDIITHKDLVQDDPAAFWAQTAILNLQKQGNSQRELVQMLTTSLNKQGIQHGSPEPRYSVYIDDAIFTGNTVLHDLKEWVQSAPDKHRVHVLTFGHYKSGQQHAQQALNKVIKASKKDIKITFHARPDAKLMNFLAKRNISQSMWPTQKVLSHPLIQEYAQQITRRKNKIHYRQTQKNPSLMPEYARHAMEEEFLIAGVQIINRCKSPSRHLKPLGYSPYPGFGFGSILTTYRNCPQNCPLALWWGSQEPNTDNSAAWYPLMERAQQAE